MWIPKIETSISSFPLEIGASVGTKMVYLLAHKRSRIRKEKTHTHTHTQSQGTGKKLLSFALNNVKHLRMSFHKCAQTHRISEGNICFLILMSNL